jgi:hypothetical protein
MPGSKEAKPIVDLDHEFTTIDDAIGLAEELLKGLNKLGEYKHPLDVRRGVDNLIDKDENSKILKAGAKTYFFDLKETKDKKPFLLITESRFKGEDEERERSSIVIFEQNIPTFAEAIAQMAAKLE